MTTYRVGGSWKAHTIIAEGSEPADENGKRPDDLPVAWVDSAAPEGLAERICRLLNGDDSCGAAGPGQLVCRRLAHTSESDHSAARQGRLVTWR